MLVAAALLVVSGLVLLLTRAHLTARLDADVQSSADSFASGPAQEVKKPADLATAARRWLQVRALPEDQLAEVRTTTTRPLSGVGTLDLTDFEGGPQLLRSRSIGWHVLQGDGPPLRALTIPLLLGDRQIGTLVVGASEGEVQQTLSALLTGMIWASVAGLFFAALLGFFTVRRTLRPLGQISSQAQAIQETGDLQRRVALTGPRDEVGRLAVVFDHMLDRLQEAFGLQQRFLADASHELRTPLTVVRGQLELLGQEIDSEQGKRSARIGLEEVDRMGRIVEDLLLLARLEEGMQLKSEPVEVDLVLQEAMLRGLLIAPRDITVDAAGNLFAEADPGRLLQVITNLVSNAIQHAGDDASIKLIARRAEDRVLIDVSDTGVGIVPQDIPHVFDRLYRGSMPKLDVPGGAGLGLAIASSLTEAMGGAIRVTSTPGVGTTFSLTFRACAPDGPDAPAERRARERT
jgi:two-component system OmpR family sensor kinase